MCRLYQCTATKHKNDDEIGKVGCYILWHVLANIYPFSSCSSCLLRSQFMTTVVITQRKMCIFLRQICALFIDIPDYFWLSVYSENLLHFPHLRVNTPDSFTRLMLLLWRPRLLFLLPLHKGVGSSAKDVPVDLYFILPFLIIWIKLKLIRSAIG